MTTKRFYVAESNLIDGYCVFDRKKKYAFSPKPRKADCLNDAHILNELNDENKRLNQTNQELYDKLQLTMSEKSLKGGEVSILKRENEQLKSEINMLKTTIGRNEGYIDRLTHKGEWR